MIKEPFETPITGRIEHTRPISTGKDWILRNSGTAVIPSSTALVPNTNPLLVREMSHNVVRGYTNEQS